MCGFGKANKPPMRRNDNVYALSTCVIYLKRLFLMRKCDYCEKASQKVNKRKKVRSAYNPVNRYRQQANLQMVRLPSGEKIKLCTNCRNLVVKGRLATAKH
ncbi:MAG: hypothetical protein UU76_C0010G0001 [Parcubacteria group bacterium GW2011_GWC1_41_7]|nr:MAG: hypothetical protein UU76_C0010G0001 [Parcubacteria group bacterium GW2011_GWC1_41_7]